MTSVVLDERLNFDVSRETFARLQRLHVLLAKWTPAINLVSKASMPDAWSRHIIDSAQLFPLASKGFRAWVDLGSGGGFPGLVVAILSAEANPDAKVHLVDSDQRKATFLREALRDLGVVAHVHVGRVEALPPFAADVVSARALAPLVQLCDYAHRHLSPDGTALFLKGENHAGEVSAAKEVWDFAYEEIQSVTDPRAVVCKLKGIARV